MKPWDSFGYCTKVFLSSIPEPLVHSSVNWNSPNLLPLILSHYTLWLAVMWIVMQHWKNKKWVAAVITFNKNCKADDCDLVSDFRFEGMVKIMAARFSYLSLMSTGDNFNKIHSDFFEMVCIQVLKHLTPLTNYSTTRRWIMSSGSLNKIFYSLAFFLHKKQ